MNVANKKKSEKRKNLLLHGDVFQPDIFDDFLVPLLDLLQDPLSWIAFFSSTHPTMNLDWPFFLLFVFLFFDSIQLKRCKICLLIQFYSTKNYKLKMMFSDEKQKQNKYINQFGPKL